MRSTALATANLVLVCAIGNATLHAQDADRGQQLLAAECGFCHGPNARGGASGPDLTRSPLVQEDDRGKQLGEFLRAGRPDRGMPKFDQLSNEQIADLAAFSPRDDPLDGQSRRLQSPRHPRGRPEGRRIIFRLLSTAGELLFGNDGGGNFVAYDARTGTPLWHAGLGINTSNGPETFLLDGRQFVVVGAGDALYAFALQP